MSYTFRLLRRRRRGLRVLTVRRLHGLRRLRHSCCRVMRGLATICVRLATTAIATILCWTVGIVVAMGWELGVMESMDIAILIGISCAHDHLLCKPVGWCFLLFDVWRQRLFMEV